jgi:hypothetical protein
MQVNIENVDNSGPILGNLPFRQRSISGIVLELAILIRWAVGSIGLEMTVNQVAGNCSVLGVFENRFSNCWMFIPISRACSGWFALVKQHRPNHVE